MFGFAVSALLACVEPVFFDVTVAVLPLLLVGEGFIRALADAFAFVLTGDCAFVLADAFALADAFTLAGVFALAGVFMFALVDAFPFVLTGSSAFALTAAVAAVARTGSAPGAYPAPNRRAKTINGPVKNRPNRFNSE